MLGELAIREWPLYPSPPSRGMCTAGIYLLLVGGGPVRGGWHRYGPRTRRSHWMLALPGSRVPGALRLFLLSLAIFDDIGAILIVAVGYGEPLNWVALGTGGLGFAFVAGIALLGIRSIPVYFAMGAAIWLAFDASGVHATLVGVILGLMTPARRWVSEIRLHAILDRVIAHPPATIAAVTPRHAATSIGQASRPAKQCRRSSVSRSRSIPGSHSQSCRSLPSPTRASR